MKNLLTLLEKFSRALNKDTLLKERIVQIVKEETGVVTLLPERITLKDGLLTLSAGPAAHNEIRLKEEGIREAFRAARVPVSRILYK